MIADPRSYARAAHEIGPVFWDEVAKVWVVAGYAEAQEVLRDYKPFRSARTPEAATLEARGMQDVARIAQMVSQQMLFIDPPDHTRIRTALQGAFRPSALKARESVVKAIVERLLDQLPAEGVVDLVSDFAGPLPTLLIASRLGLEEEVATVLSWAEAYETLLGSFSTLPHVQDQAIIPALLGACSTLREVARQRRGSGNDDLITLLADALAPAGMEGEQLEHALDEVAANCIVLVGGGYQTLTQLVTFGLVRLSQNPSIERKLRAEPGYAAKVVDEVMRLDGSSQYVARRVARDVELGGCKLAAGDTVMVLLAAANLDPNAFPEPERFDPDREGRRHLGFSLGRHHCLGAGDAEQAARLALLGFLDRYASFGLDGEADQALSFGQHANTRGPKSARFRLGRTVTVADTVPLPTVPSPPALRSGRPAPFRNNPAIPLSGERFWMDAVAEVAERAPGQVAIETLTGARITYAELDRAATALAYRAQALGVEPGMTVAIFSDREPEAYVAALAIARAGGAFLAVDRHCPNERMRAMLEAAKVSVVCLQPHLEGQLPSPAGQALALLPIELEQLLNAPQLSRPISGVRLGDTAYVVFTSGSTGTPKAISIDHEAICNLQLAQRQVYRLTLKDRLLQWFSANFDGWQSDLFLGLTHGATLVLAPPAAGCVGPELERVLHDGRVTVAKLTPSAWRTLHGRKLPESLRIVAAAGEPLNEALVRELSAPGRRVLNLYGPAEAAIWTSWHECQPGQGDPPIGLPIANKRLYLLNDDGTPVSIGEVGQLWIGGAGIGRYLGQHHLMQERFRPDPEATHPGQLMYATGDLCRWQPDGTLEYLGRRDRQVKLRGQRIELEEVERVLTAMPGLTHAAAWVNGEALEVEVAAVDDALTEEQIRSYLRQRVHSAMVPSRISITRQPKLAISGKLELRRPETQPAAPIRRTLEVVDPELVRLTWQVAQIYARCLGLAQRAVRHDSDFFLLGGDSLSLAELLASIEEQLGIRLEFTAVIDEPTPEGMAALIAKRRAA